MLRLIILALMALTLYGCGIPGPTKYKAATPEAQVRLDQAVAECKYDAEKTVRAPQGQYRTEVGAYLDMKAQKEDLFFMCAKAKGWELER